MNSRQQFINSAVHGFAAIAKRDLPSLGLSVEELAVLMSGATDAPAIEQSIDFLLGVAYAAAWTVHDRGGCPGLSLR